MTYKIKAILISIWREKEKNIYIILSYLHPGGKQTLSLELCLLETSPPRCFAHRNGSISSQEDRKISDVRPMSGYFPTIDVRLDPDSLSSGEII